MSSSLCSRLPTSWLVGIVLLLCTTTLALAAEPLEVRGRVQDPEGNALGGVKVGILDTHGLTQHFETDRRGRFRATLSDAAEVYDFQLQREGYRDLRRTVRPSSIEHGRRLELDFTLQLQRRLSRGQPLLDTEGHRIWPNSVWDAYRRGLSFHQAGDRASARAEFEAALQIEPRFPPANAGIAILRHEAGLFRQALLASQTYFSYRDEASTSPGLDAEMLQVQADAAFALGDCEVAQQAASRVLEAQPRDFSALRIQYVCYQNQGQEDLAKAAKEALKQSDSALGAAIELHNAAVARFQAGRYQDAARDFEAALELDPELTPAWSGLAKSFALGRKHVEALAASKQLLEATPEDAEAWNIRCDALVALREPEADIRACLVRLVEVDGDNPDHAHRLHQAGFRAHGAGEIEVALEFFRRALEVDDTLLVAHRALATILVEQERWEESRQAVEALLRVAPDDATGLRLRERLP